MTTIVRSARRILRNILAAGLVCTTSAFAQVEVSGVRPDQSDQSFFIDAISFAGRTGQESRIDVFTLVGHDILSFVKNKDLYDASYEMTISIFDSSDALVSEKLWTEDVKGVTFDRSVAPSATSITQRVFTVAPGQYTLRVVMRDKESKMSRQVARKLLVSNYAATDFGLSDIMLLSRVSMQGDRRSITPAVSPNIGLFPDAFFMYIEVYNARKLDSVAFVSSLMDKKGDKVLSADTVVALKPDRNELILRVAQSNTAIGDYRLIVRARDIHVADEEQSLATTNRNVIVRWQGLPRSVKDMDLAIEQLRYIAKDDELGILKDAVTPEEKQARFTEFWKKRDPNPSTARNEKMEEFYARVEYANKHFSHYLDGWRTDMGMIFIIFGPPNNVDRHPFEVDSKPYEIWTYYDLNYSIIFVDETGFGDYRLQTPIWEIWQRLRN
jgi:GWxTD domain-containing protein